MLGQTSLGASLFTSTFVVYFCLVIYAAFLPGHTKLFEDEPLLIGNGCTDFEYPRYADLINLLKLVSDDGYLTSQTCSEKLKCLAVQIIAKIGSRQNAECDLQVLELAIQSETGELQNEALMSLPIIVLYSGPRMLGAMFRKLE